nr:hypothetical protein [Tanacetum cinerariifolium]
CFDQNSYAFLIACRMEMKHHELFIRCVSYTNHCCKVSIGNL